MTREIFMAAVSLGIAVGCSQSSGGQGSGQGSTVDAGLPDVSLCGAYGCGQADAASDVAPLDTGWVCPLIPESSVGAGCDACIQTRCDARWCTCAQDQQVDDGGTQGCLTSLFCAWSCPADAGGTGESSDAGDGGEPGPCSACGPGAFTTAQQQEGQALLSCIAQSCATACPGLSGLAL
jgi:hypothetical protein